MADTLDRFMLLLPGGTWFFAAMTHAVFGDGWWIWLGALFGVVMAGWLAWAGRVKHGEVHDDVHGGQRPQRDA